MAGRYHSDEIIEKLTSLGCAFNFKKVIEPVDPEKFILESLRFYWEYNDIFFMTYSLLKHRLSSLIHVERLISLAQNSFLTSDELVLLIALCEKFVEMGDHRYKLAFKKLHKPRLKMTNPPKSECHASLIKQWGAEPALLHFGVKTRAFYEVPPKKFFTLERILKNHSWLKLRAMIGSNYRSDIIYLKSSENARTAYQAAKIAGCNTSTATRIWKSLEAVPDLEKLTG